MIVSAVQRWTLGREYRRPAGEPIRTSAYDVEPIASAREAAAFVAQHHYSGTASSTAHRFGLYQRGELAGVALFGPPASMAAHRAVFPGLTPRHAVTLGRLVLLDNVPGNGESWFLARAFELLAARGVVAVESCADPVPRTDRRGRRVFPGHAGTIYQATNGRYVGRTRPATLRILPDGSVFSRRAASKLQGGERGRAYAERQLVRHGAPPIADGEDPAAWLRCWLAQLTRPLRHHGNHRYLWCLDRRRRREVLETRAALPYPKIDMERAA